MAVINTIAVAKIVWDWINQGKGDGGQEGEEQSEGDGEGGGDPGLCLADTNYDGGVAFMTSCGAYGTSWIAIPHSDGYYLESRWWYNNGYYQELTAYGPLYNNDSLFAYGPTQPGGAYWQTWSWYTP